MTNTELRQIKKIVEIHPAGKYALLIKGISSPEELEAIEADLRHWWDEEQRVSARICKRLGCYVGGLDSQAPVHCTLGEKECEEHA